MFYDHYLFITCNAIAIPQFKIFFSFQNGFIGHLFRLGSSVFSFFFLMRTKGYLKSFKFSFTRNSLQNKILNKSMRRKSIQTGQARLTLLSQHFKSNFEKKKKWNKNYLVYICCIPLLQTE